MIATETNTMKFHSQRITWSLQNSVFANCFGCITCVFKIYKSRYFGKKNVFDLGITCGQSLLYMYFTTFCFDVRECLDHKKQESLINVFVRILSKLLLCIAFKNYIGSNTSCFTSCFCIFPCCSFTFICFHIFS